MEGDAKDHELKEALLRSFVWCLTRLEIQHQAMLATMERYQPGARAVMEEEMQRIQRDRLKEIYSAIQKDVVQAFDGVWLKRQGIDPAQ